MESSVNIIKAKLKEELNNPNLNEMRCSYLIEKIKLLNRTRASIFKKNKTIFPEKDI